MNCKYCQAELASNSSVCPACGKDNLKDDLKWLKIVTLTLVCLVMLVLLAGIVHYGVTGSFLPDWFSGDSTDPTQPSGSTQKTTVTILTKDGQVEVEAEALAEYMDDVVVTMGEHTMTNDQLQIYYWMIAYNEEKVDLSKPLTEQIYDQESGQTYHDYCLTEAVNAWREVTLMAAAGKEAGFVLDSETQEYLDGLEKELETYVTMYQYYGYDIESVDELIQTMYGPASNFDSYYGYVEATCYGGMYWSEKIEGIEVTDQQIQDYFTENEEALKNDYAVSVTKEAGNIMDIRNIMISVITKKNEDGTTVEDWEATQAAAQAIYDQWLAGELTEEAFIALVKEHSQDEASKPYDGLYTDMIKGSLAEVDVRHILIMPEDDEDEASWTEAETEAQRILDLWLENPTEENFAALANENSHDNNGKVTNGGIYTDIYLGRMVEAFEQWCFADHETGDYGIVKTEYGYHVMYFVRSDNAADLWVSNESRQSGDVAMIAGDGGYQILYFVDSEPMWIRYSRYGAQSLVAEGMLDQMLEEATYSVDTDGVVIACS